MTLNLKNALEMGLNCDIMYATDSQQTQLNPDFYEMSMICTQEALFFRKPRAKDCKLQKKKKKKMSFVYFL